MISYMDVFNDGWRSHALDQWYAPRSIIPCLSSMYQWRSLDLAFCGRVPWLHDRRCICDAWDCEDWRLINHPLLFRVHPLFVGNCGQSGRDNGRRGQNNIDVCLEQFKKATPFFRIACLATLCCQFIGECAEVLVWG